MQEERISVSNNTATLAFTNGYPDVSKSQLSLFELDQASKGITYTRDGVEASYYHPYCLHLFLTYFGVIEVDLNDKCKHCQLERNVSKDSPYIKEHNSKFD